MSTYSAVANSEISVGAPITNNLKTKERDNLLAIQENDASAPTIAFATEAGTVSAIAPSSDLDDTITTDGSQSLAALATWTPSQGLYNIIQTVNGVTLDLFVSASWRQSAGNMQGIALFDGSNMRLRNRNTSTTSVVWWQRFDG